MEGSYHTTNTSGDSSSKEMISQLQQEEQSLRRELDSVSVALSLIYKAYFVDHG